MLCSSTFSCSPAFGWDPYPIGTTYLQTVAWRENLSDAGRPPSVRRWHVSRKSSSRIGRTFMDSGSANRTLNSRSLGPSFVAMKPPYRIPLNGVPRAAIAATVLRIVSSRSEEHTSELQSQSNLVCRLLLEKKKYTHRL